MIFFINFLAVSTLSLAVQAIDFPSLTGPVTDQAKLLDFFTNRKLEKILSELNNRGGSQIAVLTIESLGGISIEEFSIKVVEKWKLGSATKDNGALLLVSKNDRKVRIEVGQGLEGFLTDALSKRIIENIILPSFKSGDFSGGILDGVLAIISITDPGEQVGTPRKRTRVVSAKTANWADIIVTILAICFLAGGGLINFILRMFGFRRRSWLGGGWGGGGGGFGGGGFGGSGGFGGFSGGGGGFSGGGSSGSW